MTSTELELFKPVNEREAEFIRTRAATPRGLRPALPIAQGQVTLHVPAGWGPTALPYVNEAQALTVPSFYAGLSLIANGVASMTPGYALAADGVTRIDTPTVLSRPGGPLMRTFEYFRNIVFSMFLEGDFIGIKADFDLNGWAQQVVPILPRTVNVVLNGDGYPTYWIGGIPFDWTEVVHIPFNREVGELRGTSIVNNFRRSLGESLDQTHYAADTYRNGAFPSGVLQTVDSAGADPDEDEVAAIKASFIEAVGNGRHTPAVLPSAIKYVPLSLSPQDMQFVESRCHNVAQVAYMLGMAPSDLEASVGSKSSVTYANREQRVLDRIASVYLPIARQVEEAWSDLLPGANTVRLDESQLLRNDSLTRAQVDALRIGSGVIVPSEARDAEGLPPFTPEQESELAKTIKQAPTPVPNTSIVVGPQPEKA